MTKSNNSVEMCTIHYKIRQILLLYVAWYTKYFLWSEITVENLVQTLY
jgi:hypothetical protein